MSLLMRLADRLLRLKPNHLQDRGKAKAIGDGERAAAKPPKRLSKNWLRTHETINGRPVVTLTPLVGSRPVTLVYVHGGAYVNEMSSAHWPIIDHLAAGTGATVVVPFYGLAPEHTVDEAFDFMSAVMARTREQRPDDTVLLAGDSAGGGLSLAFAMEHRDDHDRPAGLILLSPWVDATMSNPDAQAMEQSDAMLGIDGLRYWGEQWAGSRHVRDPRVSPALGDLRNLPPTWVYQGGRDLFLPDAEKFARDAVAVGSPVALHVAPDGFHVFVGLTFARESREVFDEVRKILVGVSGGPNLEAT